jgi:hypothetical protein
MTSADLRTRHVRIVDMQPIYVSANPIQALLMEVEHLFCIVSSGGHRIWPDRR